MSLTRRTALLSGIALLSVGAGVGIAAGTTGEPPRAASPVAVGAPLPVEDEGPGTEVVPVVEDEGTEDEGPGTETVPARVEDEGPGTETVPTREGGEDEGPGTDTRPAPVYGSATPSTWALATPRATVYGVPGDTDTRTGTITDRSADIAGTGRTATVGRTEWFEVKVPGATTGWVVGTELERR